MIKLSILIPSLDKRAGQLAGLLKILDKQLTNEVEVCVSLDSGKKSIGQKRNELMRDCKGEYCASIDDDDRVSPQYIDLLLEAIKTKPDCCSLIGSYTKNGRFPKLFKHSIKYNGWYEESNILYRFPNHLNCIRTDIARQMTYPEISHGEDKSFSEQLQASGLLKVEYEISPIIYIYDYKTNK